MSTRSLSQWATWLMSSDFARILCLMMLLMGCTDDRTPELTEVVPINGRIFTLELAVDEAARIRGLSDRTEITADGGMLFVFPAAGDLNFYMRRCLVPIDLILLDPSGRVVALHTMEVEPYDRPENQLKLYGSKWTAQFAIELKGGTIEQIGIQMGDRIELPWASLKARAS